MVEWTKMMRASNWKQFKLIVTDPSKSSLHFGLVKHEIIPCARKHNLDHGDHYTNRDELGAGVVCEGDTGDGACQQPENRAFNCETLRQNLTR